MLENKTKQYVKCESEKPIVKAQNNLLDNNKPFCRKKVAQSVFKNKNCLVWRISTQNIDFSCEVIDLDYKVCI